MGSINSKFFLVYFPVSDALSKESSQLKTQKKKCIAQIFQFLEISLSFGLFYLFLC